LERAHVTEGDELLVLVEENGRIALERMVPEMTLESLLAGVTPANKHKLQEWGKPVGNEK